MTAPGGWDPMEREWWDVIREKLPKPLVKEAAWFDLRRLHSSKDGIPSRRVLAARWGWTDGQVRSLLRSVDEWWDDHKGEAPRLAAPRPADGPGPTPHQTGPNRTQPDPTGTAEAEQVEGSDPTGPTLHQTGPSDSHTRGVGQRQDRDKTEPPPNPPAGGPAAGEGGPLSATGLPEEGDPRVDHVALEMMQLTQPGTERSPLFEAPAPEPSVVDVVGATPKKTRSRKRAATGAVDPIRALTDAWSRAWAAEKGTKYGWNFHIERAQVGHLLDGLERDDAGQVVPSDVARFEKAAGIYIAAADAGQVWPRDAVPSIRFFIREFNRWMQEADDAIAAANAPPVEAIGSRPARDFWPLIDAQRVALGLPPTPRKLRPKVDMRQVEGSLAWHAERVFAERAKANGGTQNGQ